MVLLIRVVLVVCKIMGEVLDNTTMYAEWFTGGR